MNFLNFLKKKYQRHLLLKEKSFNKEINFCVLCKEIIEKNKELYFIDNEISFTVHKKCFNLYECQEKYCYVCEKKINKKEKNFNKISKYDLKIKKYCFKCFKLYKIDISFNEVKEFCKNNNIDTRKELFDSKIGYLFTLYENNFIECYKLYKELNLKNDQEEIKVLEEIDEKYLKLIIKNIFN